MMPMRWDVFKVFVEEMGKGLIDKSGKVSVNGERTVLKEKDIEQTSCIQH